MRKLTSEPDTRNSTTEDTEDTEMKNKIFLPCLRCLLWSKIRNNKN